MNLVDLADMPAKPGSKPPTNGLRSVSAGLVFWGQNDHQRTPRTIDTVTCATHGATMCTAVISGGKIWRCPTCNEGAFQPAEAGIATMPAIDIEELRRLGNNLVDHLNGLLADTHEKRYTNDGGCRGCYDAVQAWKAAQP